MRLSILALTATLASGRGVHGWHLSITHTDAVASAVVAAVA